MLKIIKNWLNEAKGIWPNKLPSILWAYKTSTRISTGETLFQLAYGNKAVILVEVGLTSDRVENHDESKNNTIMRLQLDLVDGVRAIDEQRLA